MSLRAYNGDRADVQKQAVKPVMVRDNLFRAMVSPLWMCLLVALLARVWLLIHTGGVIDGDEAVAGIQAEHILRGEFPAYFYGQAYMGSLEAYLVALLFAAAGPSVWALRAEPILLSLVVVWLTWVLAGLLAEFARLPAPYRLFFKTVAALGAAIPPLYDVVLEMRLLGGYIETFVLMLVLLIAALRLTKRWQAGASSGKLVWYWVITGFVAGLGIWVNPLIVSAILAAALWISGYCVVTVTRQPQGEHAEALKEVSKKLLLAVAAIPASLVGLLPALLWGAAHRWANIAYIRNLGGSWSLHRLHVTAQVAVSFTDCVAPRLIGGALPYQSSISAALHWLLLVSGAGCLLVVLALVGFSFLQTSSSSLLLSLRRVVALPLLFAACTVFVFCTGSASVYELLGCNLDDAGRYATPLMLALPFFIAAASVVALMAIDARANRKRAESRSSDASSGAAPRGSHTAPWRILIAALLLASFVAHISTYILTNPGETFQSNYCLADPANNDPIIAYMQREHIHYFWANNFLAYPIVFKTNSAIIGADPAPLLHPTTSVNRLPSYTNAVRLADRPSLLLVIHVSDTYPQLLRLLDARHVTYTEALFPSQPGFEVLVVTPLNRTVSPLEPGFDLFFCVSPMSVSR